MITIMKMINIIMTVMMMTIMTIIMVMVMMMLFGHLCECSIVLAYRSLLLSRSPILAKGEDLNSFATIHKGNRCGFIELYLIQLIFRNQSLIDCQIISFLPC